MPGPHRRDDDDDTTEYRTTDVEEATRFVRAYAGDEPRFEASSDFRFGFISTCLDDFRIETVEMNSRGEARLRPRNEFTVVHLLRGSVTIDLGGSTERLEQGQSYLFCADTTALVRWDGVRLGIVRVGLDEVERVAAELRDDPDGVVQLRHGRPASVAGARYWQAVVRHINQDVLPNPVVRTDPALHREVGRQLAVSLLRVFPTSETTPPSDVPRLRPTAAMRRAVDHIQAHAAEEMTMTDVAQAARVSIRALQLQFRTVWDTTPMEYLRSVRLQRARRDLLLADPSQGDTVAAVARRWRFSHVGRFARAYRVVYDESPSTTLRS